MNKDYEELKPYFVEAYHLVTQEVYGLNFSTLHISLVDDKKGVPLDQALRYMSEWHKVPLMEICGHVFDRARELYARNLNNGPPYNDRDKGTIL